MVFLAALKMPPGAQFDAGLPPRDRGHFPAIRPGKQQYFHRGWIHQIMAIVAGK